MISTLLQAGLVALLFTLVSNPAVQVQVRQAVTLVMPLEMAPSIRPKVAAIQGGGGGGDRSLLPASKGRLPKTAVRQFVPPSAVLNNAAPRLTMEPAILAPPDVVLASVNMPNYGDPMGKIGPPSNGTGSGGGIGSGKGGGVGAGTGGGLGPGEGGGFGEGVSAIGGSVSKPIAIYAPEPEYSDEGRRARLQGTVIVELVVDPSGKTRDPKVVKSLGLGLDEQALKAVATWRFKPALKDGKPVAVMADIYVGFHLL
ncbi:MAG TPA: energy transducer TonB [Candidatus Sulfopaludibacter sp.]|nr:energy transducer TonB [Candidatus Sulfopaludibacter sp.]